MEKDEIHSKIELRSEVVSELMDREPSYVLKYGISFVLFMICCMFIASKYIPYPNTLPIKVMIKPNVDTKKFINTNDIEVEFVISSLRAKVNKGDTLAILVNNIDTIFYVSPYNGIVYRANGCKKGDIVRAGSFVMLVARDSIKSNVISAYSCVDKETVKLLHLNMTLIIKDLYVFRLKDISSIPDEDGMYTICFECTNSDCHFVYFEESLDGQIQIEDTNVYDRFFANEIKNIIKK